MQTVNGEQLLNITFSYPLLAASASAKLYAILITPLTSIYESLQPQKLNFRIAILSLI